MRRALAYPLLIAVTVVAAIAAHAQQPAAPDNLAALHATKVRLACNACHVEGDPASLSAEEALASVNRQCARCHGDSAKLAKDLLPKLPDRNINPHASHLVAVDCTVCHAGHTAAAEAYCQKCHAFVMPMPKGTGVVSR